MALIFPGVKRGAAPAGIATLALFGCLLSNALVAGEPLYVKNLSPVAGLFGLPSQRTAMTQASGTAGLALHSSVANHYVTQRNDSEAINLDGETLRFALEGRYGLADDWEVGLELPWLSHSGGHLDSLIENWHDFWGLPDGGRPDAERNLMDYRYAGPTGQFALQDDVSGLGDVTLSLSHAFYRHDATVATAVLGYKIGSGDEQKFLGSGGDDIYLALRFSGDHLTDLPLSWHGQVGYLHAGDAEVIPGNQADGMWFGGLAMDWAVLEKLSLILQVDVHSGPMDSELSAVGDEAVLLSLGASWRTSRRWTVDFSLVEDVRVESAPDITFQASIRYNPGAR